MLRSLLVLALVLSPIGCGDGITVPNGPPSTEGVIVERDRGTSISVGFPTIWVMSPPDDECGVIYTVGSSTDLWSRGADGKVREIEVDALIVGARVRVWASSAILTSCPEQAESGSVELVP